MTLGERLRKRRAQLGIEAKVVAERAGISPQYLSDIEHDQRRPTDETFLKRLTLAYDLSDLVLWYYAGVLPKSMYHPEDVSDEAIFGAFIAFDERLWEIARHAHEVTR